MKIGVIDCEATGLDTEYDRVLSLSIVAKSIWSIEEYSKRFEKTVRLINGKQSASFFFNPEMEIKVESTAIHGITNEQAKQWTTFAKQAQDVHRLLGAYDALAGFNLIRFDIPILMAEFARCGLSFPKEGQKIIDCSIILRKYEPRDLASVYKYYTGETLENAHTSEADALATAIILEDQIIKYQGEPEEFARISVEGLIDFAGKFKLKDGVPVFGFSKHKDDPVSENLGMLSWMEGKDFSEDTMKWARIFRETKGHMPEAELFAKGES